MTDSRNVRCNRTEECKKRFPDRDCGAWLVHDRDSCEPCPFSQPGDAKCVEAYDSFEDTKNHSRRVFGLMGDVAVELAARGREHDASKMRQPEKDWFDRFTPKLKGSKFPSPEYDEFLKAMDPGLELHYKENRHHPQHFEAGVNSMNLLDLLEMLADWKAAGERHADGGNLCRSILHNAERFGMSGWLKDCLLHTAEDLDWWDGVMLEKCEKCGEYFYPEQDFIVCPKCREG
jgi:hypothetical protein